MIVTYIHWLCVRSKNMQRYSVLFLCSFFIFSETFADHWNGTDYAQNSSVELSHAQCLLANIPLAENEKILIKKF